MHARIALVAVASAAAAVAFGVTSPEACKYADPRFVLTLSRAPCDEPVEVGCRRRDCREPDVVLGFAQVVVRDLGVRAYQGAHLVDALLASIDRHRAQRGDAAELP